MKLHSLIIDDFLTQFDALRAYADGALYETMQNPVDSVAYPGICTQIPREIQAEIQENLSLAIGKWADIHFTFMRLSLASVPVPHQAHTDVSMGAISLMLYLNRPGTCRGGTELVRHVSGMDRNPIDLNEQTLWQRDTNAPDMWVPYLVCEMKPNRAFIFDAALMHRSAPIGGFGDDATDGRLVLTCFLN